jgi:hypothetical protein
MHSYLPIFLWKINIFYYAKNILLAWWVGSCYIIIRDLHNLSTMQDIISVLTFNDLIQGL